MPVNAAILRLSLPSFDEFALTEYVDVFWCWDMKKFQKGGPCVPVVNRCRNWRNASWACCWTRGKVSIELETIKEIQLPINKSLHMAHDRTVHGFET